MKPIAFSAFDVSGAKFGFGLMSELGLGFGLRVMVRVHCKGLGLGLSNKGKV